MLNIILGLAILISMFLTPIATLMIMGEIFALIVTKTHKNIALLSKILAIILVCEIIFEIFLLLYLIGRSVLI
jgi:hypothetical protein